MDEMPYEMPYLTVVCSLIDLKAAEFEKLYGKKPKFVKVSERAFERLKIERKKWLPEMPDDEPYLFGLRMCVTPTVSGLTGIEVF